MSAPDAPPLSDVLLRERAWIHALARHLVRDEADADDLEQETWRVALERPPRDHRSVRGWIARVMARLAGRGRRGAGRRHRREEVAARSEAVPSTAALVAEAELHRRLVDAVLALDEPYRSAVLARYVHGFAPRTLAARSGEPVKTIASRLHRGLAMVRARLDADGRGDRRAWAVVMAALDADASSAEAAGKVHGADGGAATAAATGGPGMATAGTKSLWFGAALLLAAGAGVVWGVTALRHGDAVGDASSTVSSRPGSGVAPALAGASDAPAPHVTAAVGDTSVIRLRGRIVDVDGRPVVDAVVTAAPSDAFRFVAPADAATGLTTELAGRTAVDGGFEVIVGDEAPMHLLHVSAPGHPPFVDGPVRVGRETTIVLPRGERWEGRTLDEGGTPLPGATVSALLAMPWFRIERSTVSDEHGAFAFDAMPGDTADRPGRFPAQAWLEARAPGRAPSVLRVGGGGHAADRRRLDLRLGRGATLSGRVVDAETGEPLANAGVALQFASMGHGWIQGNMLAGTSVAQSPFEDRAIASTSTGPDGSFVLEHVPALDGPRPPPVPAAEDRRPFAGRLVVRAPGRASAVVLVRQVEDGARDALDLRLWRSVAVAGRVLRADRTPAPRAQGRISVGPPVDAVVGFTTDADGRFVASDVPIPSAPIEGTITAFGPSGEQRWPVVLRSGAPVDAGELTLPALTLPPGVEAIAVRVVREDRTPLRGAWVHAVSPRGGGTSEVEADRDGRATLYAGESLRGADGSVEVHCWAPGYARGVVRAGRGPTPAGGAVEFVLIEGRSISGRVRRSDGTPAARIQVRARWAGVDSGGARPSEDGDGYATATDDDGRFTVHDLAPGPWTLTAVATALRPGTGVPQAALPAVPAGTDDVELTLSADTRGPLARVTIAVVDDATGEPLSTARVTMRSVRGGANLEVPSATIVPLPAIVTGGRPSDPFVAPEVPVGAWSVRAWADGYAMTTLDRLDVPLEGAHVEVRLKRGSTRAVRTTGLSREETPRQLRLVAVEAEFEVSVVLDDDGRGALRGLEPGMYRPTVGLLDPARRGTSGTTRVLVSSDLILKVDAAADPIDLALVPGGLLSVDVEDPRLPGIGGPRDAASIARSGATILTLEDARGRLVARQRGVLRGRQGAFDMLAVLPGRYRVRLDAPDDAPIDLDVDVPAGDHVLRTITVGR